MDLNDAIRALTDFIVALRFDEQLTKRSLEDSVVLIQRGDRTIVLVGNDAERYRELVAAICTAVAQRRPVSKRAVTGLVDKRRRTLILDTDPDTLISGGISIGKTLNR